MEKNLFSIREAGRQGGRAGGGSASDANRERGREVELAEVAGRALSAFLVALSGSDGREVALLPLMDQGGLSGGSDAARGGSASLLMVARQGELSLMVERWQRCQRWQGGREVALLPSFLLMVPEVALDPSGRQGGRTGRGRAASLPADGREVAEVAESHLLLYIYVIDVIGLH